MKSVEERRERNDTKPEKRKKPKKQNRKNKQKKAVTNSIRGLWTLDSRPAREIG